ncbi:TetR/AcrR family transcriptional regulator [Paracoccus sp. (in: a-proteobacteria)]|uniref:TetR/AcrR family transcriptional regulator n=1 Tax=Paracoccus sp. TaxID=267 RepID=UPI00289DBCC2|nr:TetR/AcrR family transcriptional regulator [Paracoccus sp. (in: a-proteobacteria)]
MSRPSRQPREELRKAIIDAAKGILDRDGVEGLSARGIAKEIGYTAASIYNVFEAMSDILMEVNRETLVELEDMFNTLPPASAPQDRLRALCESYVDFMKANPARWNALFAGRRERETFPEWYGGAIEGLKQRLAALLIECAPGVEAARAGALAETLFIAIHGLVSLDVGRRLDIFTQRSAREIAALALEVTLASLPQKG